MLVLTRRISETLMIGDNIKITVLGVHGNQVRLGIEAPKNVGIAREEMLERDPKFIQAMAAKGAG